MHQRIGTRTQPRDGNSAIITIAEDQVVEQLQRGLEGYERIARHALSAEACSQIVAVADVAADETPAPT